MANSDCEIKYSNFGEVDDVMSVYCLIGDGNVIELYHRADDALGDNFKLCRIHIF